jgi:hypothetical protein
LPQQHPQRPERSVSVVGTSDYVVDTPAGVDGNPVSAIEYSLAARFLQFVPGIDFENMAITCAKEYVGAGITRAAITGAGSEVCINGSCRQTFDQCSYFIRSNRSSYIRFSTPYLVA